MLMKYCRAFGSLLKNHEVFMMKIGCNPFESASAGKAEVRFVDLTGRQVGYVEMSVSSAGNHTINVSRNQITSASSIIFALVTVKDQSGTKQSKIKLIRMNLN